MFVFDTNILSALMNPRPVPEVRTWMARKDKDLFFKTAISQAEIAAGLAVLPDDRHRRDLQSLAAAMFAEEFEGRVWPFDTKAAASYADIFAMRKRAGRSAAPMDLLIAAIARCHGATVVTRDTGGFVGCGLTVINPWTMP